MKIINLKEFLKLPPGAVFMKYTPSIFSDLMVKKETIGNDFIYEDIQTGIESDSSGDEMDILFEAEETGKSIKMTCNTSARDGCFEDDQLFAVYEDEDIKGLIFKLTQCKGV
jgi:hypothetical protein